MIPQWLIEKKRDGGSLSREELDFLISGYTRGEIPDYQMAALAMAVFFRGMTPEETGALTDVMLRSGETVDTSAIPLPKVDKHSTGGVGDKVSLILAPLVACCGVAVPMISGRGLGITGGTLDKLASIPGYRSDLSIPEFLRVLAACGCSIIGQTEALAPADRKLYALRDVTGTVPSIPLIVASIMSKKLAEGIDALVLDVKCGRGAFMKTREQAVELARVLTQVGRSMGKRMSALVTAMDQPLGRCAGNALEVTESVQTLKGEGPLDLTELTMALGARMLVLAGRHPDDSGAARELRGRIASGEALARFRDMVRLHGGDVGALDHPDKMGSTSERRTIACQRDGFVTGVDAAIVGRACLLLGAGRTRTTDRIDPAAGVSALRKIGEAVQKGAPLAVAHSNDARAADEAAALLAQAFEVSSEPPQAPPLILQSVE